MLKELKTVITVRAKDREERERRALKRMRGEDSDEEVDEEDSGAEGRESQGDRVNDLHNMDSCFGLRKRVVEAKEQGQGESQCCTNPNKESQNQSESSPDSQPQSLPTSESQTFVKITATDLAETDNNTEEGPGCNWGNLCTECAKENSSCKCEEAVGLLDKDNADFSEKDNEVAWDDLENRPYRPLRQRIEVGDEDDSMESRRERLSQVAAGIGGGFPFTANVAALAAARGQAMRGGGEETFGDDEGSDSEGVVE